MKSNKKTNKRNFINNITKNNYIFITKKRNERISRILLTKKTKITSEETAATFGSDFIIEEIINEPTLQNPWARVIECVISASVWIILLLHTIATAVVWLFGSHFAWLYLFVPASNLEGTTEMAIFLLKYGIIIFLILYGWAQWNYWRYGRLERRKPRPPIPDEVICEQFKLPIDTIYTARNTKFGNIYFEDVENFKIETILENTVQSGIKLKVNLRPHSNDINLNLDTNSNAV